MDFFKPKHSLVNDQDTNTIRPQTNLGSSVENSSFSIIRWNAINKTLKEIYYIVDTNVLLDFRDLLDDIGGKVFDSYQITIVIPYATIIELDGLKRGTKLCGQKVQDAIKWCNKHFESNLSSWIKGQTYDNYIDANSQFEGTDADGRIRNCALLYMKTKSHVALITNDINLKNRAILCGLKAHDVKQLYQILDDSTFVVGDLINDMKISSSPQKPFIKSSNKQLNSDDNLSNYLTQIRASITQSLGDILKNVMIETYGELWDRIILIKPPWSSKTVIKCFKKHWIAIFTDKLKNETQTSLEIVSKSLDTIPLMPTFSEVLNLAKNVLDLYDTFDRTKFDKYIKRFELIKDPDNSEKKLDEYHIIKDSLNDIGNFSNAISMHNKNYLQELPNIDKTKEKITPVFNSLTNLQSSLISLGYTLMRLSEDPSLPTCLDIQRQTKNFWMSAQCRNKNIGISSEQYIDYFSTNQSKDFLKHYIIDLENIINPLQYTLFDYESLY